MTREFTILPPVRPVIVQNARPDLNSDPKTVILCGVARSGTSAVSAALHELGFNMDDMIFDGHFERPAFKTDIDRTPFIMREIERLNNAYPTWGLQCWHRVEDVVKLSKMTRNPHLVCVFRDPIAVAARWHSAQEEPKSPMDVILRRVQRESRDVFDCYEEATIPKAAVSFERFRSNLNTALVELMGFLGMPITSEKLNAARSVVGSGSGYVIQS